MGVYLWVLRSGVLAVRPSVSISLKRLSFGSVMMVLMVVAQVSRSVVHLCSSWELCSMAFEKRGLSLFSRIAIRVVMSVAAMVCMGFCMPVSLSSQVSLMVFVWSMLKAMRAMLAIVFVRFM